MINKQSHFKWVDQESKQHPKERDIHANSSIFNWYSLMQAKIKEEASQPQQDSALDHKWFSFHMVEARHSYWYSLSSPSLQIGLYIAIWRAKLESIDYPLL